MTASVPTVAAPAPPAARGPLSEFLLAHLRAPAHDLSGAPRPADGPLDGEDFQLSLYVLYELHYRSFSGVDPLWEWEPSLLAVRAGLERAFEAALRDALPAEPDPVADVPQYLTDLLAAADGPSLSRFLEM